MIGGNVKLKAQVARAWPALWRGGAGVLLVNAPFWWLSQSVFMSRALINLDSVVAVVVVTVAPRLGILLLLLSWGLDGAFEQSLIYHFSSPLEFISSVRFASMLSWWDWLSWRALLMMVPFLAALWGLRVLVLRHPARINISLASAIWVVGLVVLDSFNGSSLLRKSDIWRWSVNLTGSRIATLALQWRGADAATPLKRLPPGDSVQAMIDIPDWASKNPHGSVLLVIVESLGAPAPADLRKWLDAQVRSSAFDLQITDVPFRGSTTSGEMRTLCGLSGSYATLDAVLGLQCLPRKLDKKGWQTAGFHGFYRHMFNRERWWPLTGLQNVFFMDSPLLTAKSQCGRAFSGVCDEALIAQALHWLRPGARFAYVLTLNTHLPLPPITVPIELEEICQANATPLQACELIAALGALLHEAVAQASATVPRPLLVLVGDHAPPFHARDTRAVFRPSVVPAYVLRPNEMSVAHSGSVAP